MSALYYEDEQVQLWHGDCLSDEIAPHWLAADVLVTDPPYGRGWRQGNLHWTNKRVSDDTHAGIANDESTRTRDEVLRRWGTRPSVMFGDLMLPPPPNTMQVLVYRKPPNAGTRGAMGGYRRDVEAIYLIGRWPAGLGGRTSVIATRAPSQGNPSSPQGRFQHPHAKPLDVMEELVSGVADGLIADPFAGSGSTLVAAKALGRKAIGVELEERYCEIAARRLSQGALDLGGIA